MCVHPDQLFPGPYLSFHMPSSPNHFHAPTKQESQGELAAKFQFSRSMSVCKNRPASFPVSLDFESAIYNANGQTPTVWQRKSRKGRWRMSIDYCGISLSARRNTHTRNSWLHFYLTVINDVLEGKQGGVDRYRILNNAASRVSYNVFHYSDVCFSGHANSFYVCTYT